MMLAQHSNPLQPVEREFVRDLIGESELVLSHAAAEMARVELEIRRLGLADRPEGPPVSDRLVAVSHELHRASQLLENDGD